MIKMFVATMALALSATPALARAGDPEAPAAAAPVAPVSVARPSEKTKYCLVDTRTGSRIPTRTCKTRAQWLAVGVDLDAK